MTIEFNYEGKDYTGELEGEFFIEEQKWRKVSVDGINWLVPQGWPNNAYAICEEEHPAAYSRMLLTLPLLCTFRKPESLPALPSEQ